MKCLLLPKLIGPRGDFPHKVHLWGPYYYQVWKPWSKGESKTKTTNKDKEWGPLLRRLELIQQMGMGIEDKEHRRVNKWRYEFQEVLHKLRTQIQFNRPSMTFPLSISVHPGLYPKLIFFHEMFFEVPRLKILWSKELWIIFG